MVLDTCSEEELLALVCNNDDKGAYERLYCRLYPNLLRFAYSKTANLEESEDIVQDILLQLWNRRHKIILIERLESYLIKAVKYKVLDQIGKQKNQAIYMQSIDLALTTYTTDTDFLVRESLFKDYIDHALNSLPPRMREAFLLSRENGLSHEEIAIQLGISQHTVATHIKNALKILKKKLLTNSFMVLFY